MYTIIILLLVTTYSSLYSSEEVEVLRSPSREPFPTHQNAPQKFNVTHNNSATLQDMVAEKNVITSSTSQIDSLIEKLLKADNNTDFDDCFQEIRNELSYTNQDYQALLKIKEKVELLTGQPKRALKHYDSNQTKWSTQKKKSQVFMGQLFFPVQFDSLFETRFALITREPMQYLISLSASFGNILAQYHLKEILKMYNESGVPKSTKSFISTLVETTPAELNEPHYYCGLLCITKGQMKKSYEHFKIGYEKGDMWSSYRYGLENTSEEENKTIYEKLKKISPGLAKLLLAELETHSEKKIDMFLEAGKAGIAKGYIIAGILEEDTNSSKEYYLKAAKGGILGAYDNVAEIHLKANEIEEAKKMYVEKAHAGDPKGFVQCGDLYWDESQKDMALSLYEQAGFRGYHKRIHLTNSRKRKEELIQEQENELLEKIKRLKGTFSDDE